MADENLDPTQVKQFWDEVRDGINDFTDYVRQGGRITGAELEKLSSQLNISRKSAENLRKGFEGLNEVAFRITALGSTLANGQGRVSTFNDAIGTAAKVISGFAGVLGPLGALFGGAVEAASAGLQFVNKEFEKTYESFTALSKVGAAGANGIQDIRQQFLALGVPLNQLTNIIGKNATRLAGLEGTVSEAALSLSAAAGAAKSLEPGFKLSDMQLRMLGYTSEEIADTFAQYADLQRRFGVQQTLSTDQLIQGSMRYGKELDALAKLTGKSREQLRAELDQAMLNERFAAHIRKLQLTGQENAAIEQQKVVTALLAMGNRQLAEAVMAGVTGFYTTPEAKAAVVSMQGFSETMQSLNSPAADAGTALQNLQDGAKDYVDRFSGLAEALGPGTTVTRNFIGNLDLATRDAGEIAKSLEKAGIEVEQNASRIAKPGEETLETPTEAIANAMKSFEQAGANISYLATQADFATNMVSGMAEAVEDITGWINNFIETGSLYPTFDKTTAQYQKESTNQLSQANVLLSDIKKIQEEIRDKGPTGDNTLSAERVNVLNGELNGLNNELKKLRNEMQKTPRIGKEADTAYKTIVEYLAKTKQGTVPGIVPTFRGNEWTPDLTSGAPNQNSTSNITNPEVNKPISINTPEPLVPDTAQTGSGGGIMTGPKTGYKATLHGTEAVVPLDGTRKIPVEITDSRDASVSLKMMETQIARLEEVVEAIKENTRINEKMFRSNYG